MQCGGGGGYVRSRALAGCMRLSIRDAMQCNAVRRALPNFVQVDRAVRKAVPPKGSDESFSMHKSIFVWL